jgi:hypothetical protein
MIYYSLELIKYEFHVFKTGDWLISYDYGFIRRGLIGSFFYITVKYFNLSSSELVWIIFIVQNIFYILIFYFVQKIYLQNKKNYFNLILFLSPAYILFPYYDFAGGYRKEIITFLSFVILSYSYYKEIKSTKVIWASLILYIIALFSHEATIFVLPFFIFILLKIKKSKLLSFKKTYTFIIIFIATTLISIILSYLSSTNSEKNIIIVNNTCKYLISIGFDNKICETAFIFIARTFKENLLEVTDSIYPRLTITFLLFFLSILPVFFF